MRWALRTATPPEVLRFVAIQLAKSVFTEMQDYCLTVRERSTPNGAQPTVTEWTGNGVTGIESQLGVQADWPDRVMTYGGMVLWLQRPHLVNQGPTCCFPAKCAAGLDAVSTL